MKKWLKKWLRNEPPHLHDDFLERLRVAAAGEGMISDGNIYAFDFAIRHLPSTGGVLEIGSFAGMSTNILSWLLRKHGQTHRLFFTCDPWVYEGFHDRERTNDAQYLNMVDGSQDFTRAEYCQFVHESFLKNTRFFSRHHLPHSFQMTSDAFFDFWKGTSAATDLFGREVLPGGQLAFCYIDGNHALDFVGRDVENCLQFLVSGGWLLLDDSADGSKFGSSQLAQRLRHDPRLQLVMKTPHYFFKKR